MKSKLFLCLQLITCSLQLMCCAGEDIFPSIGTNLANPIEIVIDSDANRAYLVNSNNKVLYDTGSFQVLDISTPEAPARVGTTDMDSFSGQAYPDAAGGYIYLTNRLSNDNQDTEDNILRININEASPDFLNIEAFADGTNPFGIAYDITSANLYVATAGSAIDYFPLGSPSNITALSLSSLDISDGSTLYTTTLRDIAIIGRQAFVTRPSGGVLVVDLDENNVDYYISDITSPRDIATDGTSIYVASNELSGTTIVPTLFVLNPATLTAVAGNTAMTLVDKDDAGILTATIEVGTDPQEIEVATDYVFVSNMGADTVSVINRAANTKATDIAVGDEPFGMAVYSPGGVDAYLYVTNIQSNTVSIINIGTLAVVASY